MGHGSPGGKAARTGGLTRTTLVVLSAWLSLAACDNPQEPKFVRPPDAVDVPVSFCFLGPSWIAIKEDGYDWAPFPTSFFRREYVLPVTQKVAVAWGYASTSTPDLSDVYVLYVTADELKSMLCGPPTGSLFVSAPLIGVQSGERVLALMGGGTGSNSLSSSSVGIAGVGSGPQDLVATLSSSTSSLITKLILRHDVTVPANHVLDPLRFDSSEAVALVPVKMVSPGGMLLPSARFMTNHGTSMDIFPLIGSGDTAIVRLPPASVLAPGDIFAAKMGSVGRYQTRYFAAPVAQAFAFGPALLTPTVTTVETSPAIRFRLRLPSQPEYPAVVRATFGEPSGHSFTVMVTSGFLGGTPATWDVEVPDLSKVLKAQYLLGGSASSYVWSVEAWSGPVASFFSPFGAVDGQTVRCAVASQSFALLACSPSATISLF